MCNIIDIGMHKEISVIVTFEDPIAFFRQEVMTKDIWVELDNDERIIPGEVEYALSKVMDIRTVTDIKVLGNYTSKDVTFYDK